MGTLSRIEPATNTVTTTISLGASPTSLTYAGGRLWVSTAALAAPVRGGRVARLEIAADPDSIDPAVAATSQALQFEYATCAKLLNYPDRPAPLGYELVPEVARWVPTVGRRPDLPVRHPAGFRFAPPSGEP